MHNEMRKGTEEELFLQSNFSNDRQFKVINHVLLTGNELFTSNTTCVSEISVHKCVYAEYCSSTDKKVISLC